MHTTKHLAVTMIGAALLLGSAAMADSPRSSAQTSASHRLVLRSTDSLQMSRRVEAQRPRLKLSNRLDTSLLRDVALRSTPAPTR